MEVDKHAHLYMHALCPATFFIFLSTLPTLRVLIGWTRDFIDISGPSYPIPRFNTKAKMRWDDDFLYVAAQLEEKNIWATLKEHNSVIFHDNDFEVFVDPDGDTHYYKEFEINAFNTTWSLSLNQPYDDNGYENSTRVFGKHGWDDPGLKSGVFVQGDINSPAAAASINKFWTVEIAFPLAALALNNTVGLPVQHGQYWRINFSRVEWQVRVSEDGSRYEKVPNTPEDNWVWSPQYAVAMHRPERWSYLQFSTEAVNATEPVKDPDFTIRHAAVQIYYAQQAHHKDRQVYAGRIEELLPYVPASQKHAVDGTCGTPLVKLSGDKDAMSSGTDTRNKVPLMHIFKQNTDLGHIQTKWNAAADSQGWFAMVFSEDGTRFALIADDRQLIVRDVMIPTTSIE